MASITPATGTTPPSEHQTPIQEAIGKIRDKRVRDLTEYKEKSGLFKGISSFGGPRDSFRKEALSMQRVQEIINNRIYKIGLGGTLFGAAAYGGAAVTAAIIGLGSASFVLALATIFTLTFGTVLLPFIGAGIAIGGAEGIGRLVNKWLAGKEQEKIKNLGEIQNKATLVKHWKELKQGDRCFLLGKMALKDEGFETEYDALQKANVLNNNDTKYFNGTSLLQTCTTTHSLSEEEKNQFYYFRKQSISSDFLEKKDFKVLLKLHEAAPDSIPIKIALCHKIINASSNEQRQLFSEIPNSAVDQLLKLPKESRKNLFNKLLSSIMEDTSLKEDNLTHFFSTVHFLTTDLYKDDALKTSNSLLKEAEAALKQPLATPEVRLAEIKKIIPKIQEAIKDKPS